MARLSSEIVSCFARDGQVAVWAGEILVLYPFFDALTVEDKTGFRR